MALIVFSLLAVVALFILLGLSVEETSSGYEKVRFKFRARQVLSLCGALILLLGCFTIVPVNKVGILYSPIGGTKEITLQEGFASKSILDKVYTISTEMQSCTLTGIITQTKDSQFLTSILDIKYKVSDDTAYLVFKQFRTLDNMAQQMMVSKSQEDLESITAKYNVFDALGEAKPDIQAEFEEKLRETFKAYGVHIDSAVIQDMEGGTAVEEAIAKQAEATQAIEIAEAQLKEAEIKAQQQVKEAQAAQDAAKINAETLLIESQAQKEANELLTESLNDLIIANKYAEAFAELWDGVLPKFAGDGAGLIFDTSDDLNTTP